MESYGTIPIIFCNNREMDILMVIKSTVQVRKLILTLLIILIILQSCCAGARVICWVCKRKTHWLLRFISSTLRMNANFLVLPGVSWTQPAIRISNSELKSERTNLNNIRIYFERSKLMIYYSNFIIYRGYFDNTIP